MALSFNTDDMSHRMNSLPLIPTPWAVRFRLVREKMVPVAAFVAVLVAAVTLWRQYGFQGHAVGIAEGNRSVITSAQPGILESVAVEPYHHVKAGQTLATLRPLDPRLQLDLVQVELNLMLAQFQPSLAEEHALDYERIRLELLRTQAELAVAQANFVRSDNEERRNRPLYEEKLVTEEIYDLSLQTRNLYLAEIQAKSNAVAEIQFRLESLRLLGEPSGPHAHERAGMLHRRVQDLLSRASNHLASVALVAPFDGMIAAVHRRGGEQVAPGEVLFTLSSPRPDRIVGYMRQPYTVIPKVGQRVRITTRDHPRTNYGSVIVEVGAQVEVITNAAAFVRTGMLVDAALPFVLHVPPASNIRPGELVDLLIERTPVAVAPTAFAPTAIAPTRRGNAAAERVSAPAEGVIITYSGMCDASAGVALDRDVLVVADDEESLLRVYDRSDGGAPLRVLDLTSFLRGGRGSKEADIEGSARVGERIYWISSHGRNAEGKEQTSRYRFFATRVVLSGQQPSLEPDGVPYKHLLQDLISAPQLAGLGLDQAARRAPKAAGGLNIEGLCSRTDGSLLIGFRNPLPEGRALVVPLLNPRELPLGGRAQFGLPRLLDLGGLGVRSLEQVEGRYYVLAGPAHGQGKPRLYVWSGGESPPVSVEIGSLAGLNPEAITVYERDGSRWFHVLSDDGAVKVGGIEAKRLKDPVQKTFRGVSFPLPQFPGVPAQRLPRQHDKERTSERIGELARAGGLPPRNAP